MKLQIILSGLLLILINQISFSQSKKEIAYEKALQAVELMNSGKYDESITLLKESQSLDTSNFLYPYEIALAYTYKEEYDEAIKILEDVIKNMSTQSDIFQLLGNNYSMAGDKESAIKVYENGIEQNPNSGNLYLEKGNIYLIDENYNEAIKNYRKGIEVDQEFPSNYYRLAKLYLLSTNKLKGLIYGEIFMNLERTTKRTQEISNLLFSTYKESIKFMGDSSSIDFCEIVIDANDISEEEIRLPFCAIFGKSFIMSIIDQDTLTLKSLSEIRTRFLDFYFEQDFEKYPNVLFNYHGKMKKEEVFNSYNYYLFQMAEQEEFNSWSIKNKEEFETFVKWYTNVENFMRISESDVENINKK